MSLLTHHRPTGEAPAEQPQSPKRRRGKTAVVVGTSALAVVGGTAGVITHLSGPKPTEAPTGPGADKKGASEAPALPAPTTAAATPSAEAQPAPAVDYCTRLGQVAARLAGTKVSAANCSSNPGRGIVTEVDVRGTDGQLITVAVIDANVAGQQTQYNGTTYSGFGRLPDFTRLNPVYGFSIRDGNGRVHSAGYNGGRDGDGTVTKGEVGVGPGPDPDEYILVTGTDGFSGDVMHAALQAGVNAATAK